MSSRLTNERLRWLVQHFEWAAGLESDLLTDVLIALRELESLRHQESVLPAPPQESAMVEDERTANIECCDICEWPKITLSPGDERYVGWATCNNHDCVAYGEPRASAMYRSREELDSGLTREQWQTTCPAGCAWGKDCEHGCCDEEACMVACEACAPAEGAKS